MMKPANRLALENFEVFLFDLDGTLIDGSDRHFVACVRETGRSFGHDDLIIAPGAGLRRFLREKLQANEDFIAEFCARNQERMIATPRPVRFHEDTLEFIAAHPEVSRCIVTNCHDWELGLTEKILDLRGFFPTIVYKTPDIPGKPAGDLYLKAAEFFAVAPEKCLVFEDSATGIAAGKNAGMIVVGIDRGTHRDFHEADFVISSFRELLPTPSLP